MKGAKMLRKYCAGLVTAFIAVPAFASLFNPSLSAEDAHQIKRLAVVSVMGNTVHGKTVGLTAFQNKSFDAAVPGWNLDATVTKDLVEHIVAGAKIGGEGGSVATSSSEGCDNLTLARIQLFDALRVHLTAKYLTLRFHGFAI